MINVAKEGFSFHTFELTKSITYDELRKIKNLMYKEATRLKRRVVPKKNYIKCEIWSQNGITLNIFENIGVPPCIKFVANPRVVLEEYENVGIFQYSQDNMEKVKSCIDEILVILGTSYCFEDMTLSRIDLCVNIEFSDKYMCKEYMRLLRKCNIPRNYHSDCFLPDEANYKEKNKHSFRASGRDVMFTIYDKMFQLAEENRVFSNYVLPESLIRVEVALYRPKILKCAREHLKRQSFSNAELFQMFGENSKAFMKNIIYEFFPHGQYATFNTLGELIYQLNIKEKLKKRMLYLVKKSSECKNMRNSVKMMQYEFDLSPSKISYVLNAFEEYHINPVTLPNSCQFFCLPSLRTLLQYEE